MKAEHATSCASAREALPAVSPPPSVRAIVLGRIAVFVTVCAWAAFAVIGIGHVLAAQSSGDVVYLGEGISYLAIVTLLTFSALAYLVARLGFLYRARAHARVPRALVDELHHAEAPAVTVLVPSYREERRVIRKTLLSAALQECPQQRVVLLIDDPPNPTTPEQRRLLEAARTLPGEIEDLLEEPARTFRTALEQFEWRRTPASTDDLWTLASLYEDAAAWLRELAAREEVVDHADRFFVDEVILRLARNLSVVSWATRSAAESGFALQHERVLQLYRRLVAIFDVEVTCFERKQYASLSHEPSKAMNLNGYISLLGGSFCEEDTLEGPALVPCSPATADLLVPACDYLLTLDADSVLLPEYCLRLVHQLEQPQNERVAVVQTPYSAFPGAETRVERIAGATTDVQHIVHQGMSHHAAAFWVGANALLRMRALEDIVEVEESGGWEIRRYISDRTVIEDTESSIDLLQHGWSILSYPERLAYSATPPDFGSLCIQRRRWADGGLLILPKMWRYWRLARDRGRRLRFGELCLRLNYMASIAWTSVSLLFLLAFPYDARLLNPLVLVAAVPYFWAMAEDLRASGYRRLDVFRVYGFNLILLPVNLAGVLRSLRQAVTGEKLAFARTPKVKDRTRSTVLFVTSPYLLVALSTYAAVHYVDHRQWENAVLASLNVLLAAYGILAFIGLRNSLSDLARGIVAKLYRTVPAATERPQLQTTGDAVSWASVLYYGSAQPRQLPRGAAADGHAPVPEPAQRGEELEEESVAPEVAWSAR